MSYSREFIKDKILKYDEYYGWDNAITVIYARWKITNSQYPDGFAYHHFQKELDVNAITKETFISIDNVTDEQLEAWCISGISNNTIEEIQMHNLPIIQHTHKLAQMTTHYENTE